MPKIDSSIDWSGILEIQIIPFFFDCNLFLRNESKNAKVFEKAKESMLLKKVNDSAEEKPEIKLNAGVAVLDKKSQEKDEPKEKKGLVRISKKPEKVSKEEIKKPENTGHIFDDLKWKAPDFSLLEQSQAPADAGDVEQNARQHSA